MPIESFNIGTEAALTTKPARLNTTTIAAGTAGARRTVVTGMRQGKPFLRFRSNWFVTTDLEPHWDLRSDGWRVIVEGDTPLDVSISFPIPANERQGTLPGLTAH